MLANDIDIDFTSEADESDRLLDAFMRDLDDLSRLDEARTKELLTRLRHLPRGTDDYVTLRNQIIEGWMGLVVSMATRFRTSIDFLDAVQIASEGLIAAVESVDPDRLTTDGVVRMPFLAYASRCIRRALLQHLDFHKPVRLRYDERHNQTWTRDCVRLGDEILDSNDQGTGETVDSTIASTMFPTPEEQLLRRDDVQTVHRLLAGAKPALTTDERRVIKLYYGLRDARHPDTCACCVPHTIKEIAERLNLTVMRTQSLRDHAIKKLKRAARDARGIPLSEPQVKNMLDSGMWKVRQGAKSDAV